MKISSVRSLTSLGLIAVVAHSTIAWAGALETESARTLHQGEGLASGGYEWQHSAEGTETAIPWLNRSFPIVNRARPLCQYSS